MQRSFPYRRAFISTKADTKNIDTKGKMMRSIRTNMADRVLKERKVEFISDIIHTAEERVMKQMSNKTCHTILPLSQKDTASEQVKVIARQILLKQRERAAAAYVDKNGVPILTPINGLGHFVLPLQRIHIAYCSHAGDSTGVREWLSSKLQSLAECNPGVEFVVEPRWGRVPLLRAFYLCGYSKVVCVKNLKPAEVQQVFMDLRNSSGQKLQPFHQKVKSSVPALRPIWSPFHMLNTGKNDPLERYRTQTHVK